MSPQTCLMLLEKIIELSVFKMHSSVLVVLSTLLVAATGQEVSSTCPGDGFFADAVQCDKYYSCRDGVLTEKLCSDGFVFNDGNPAVESCDFPFQVKCDGRPELQTPQPTPNCPRKYGYFPAEDPSICNKFYYCADGTSNELTCPETLVFSLETGTCVFPGQAKRKNCVAEKLFNFQCPKVPDTVAVAHPRYADPDDCQFFFVCINGNDPRKSGCKFGEVYNSQTEACDSPKNVPECKDYYTEYYRNYFATLKAEGGVASPEIVASAIASAYPVPKDIPRRVQINLDTIKPASKRRNPLLEGAQSKPSRVAPVAIPEAVPEIPEQPAAPVRTPPRRRPGNRRRPSLANRRRPGRRTTTTTTTTTPAPALNDDYYDYYYYDDAKPASPA